MNTKNELLKACDETRHSGKAGASPDKCPMTQRLLELIMDIWKGQYHCGIHGFPTDFMPYHIGLAAALLRCRSFPEFIHDNEKKKIPGKRTIRTTNDRAHDTTSPRLHIFVLPREWPIARLVFSDGSTKHVAGCEMRIFSRRFKSFLVNSMSYLPDTHDVLYPDNERNVEFSDACEHLVAMADEQMKPAKVSATEAYEVASSSGHGGFMRVPQGVSLPRNDAPPNAGFTYFIPDFLRRECKIGFSKDAFCRASMFKVGRGDIPVAMAIMRGGRFTERLAKAKNNAGHIGGEIFDLDSVFQWLLGVGNGHLRELLQYKPR